jgi:hypothetical protein
MPLQDTLFETCTIVIRIREPDLFDPVRPIDAIVLPERLHVGVAFDRGALVGVRTALRTHLCNVFVGIGLRERELFVDQHELVRAHRCAPQRDVIGILGASYFAGVDGSGTDGAPVCPGFGLGGAGRNRSALHAIQIRRLRTEPWDLLARNVFRNRSHAAPNNGAQLAIRTTLCAEKK